MNVDPGQRAGSGSSRRERAGTVLYLCAARAAAVERLVRIVHSFEAMEARNYAVAGHHERARELARAALRFAEDNDYARFFGGVALGALARSTRGQERRQAIAEGRALLARGAISHNHFYFRQDAIEASLDEGDLDAAEALADAMDAYMAKEPIGRQRLLADRAARSSPHGVDRRIRSGSGVCWMRCGWWA